MLKKFCDLCGKPIDSDSQTFKIKELKVSWNEFWWEQIDAHNECIKKLFDSKKKNNDALSELEDL